MFLDHDAEARSAELWASLLAQAQARRLSGEAGQRYESLEAIRRAAHIVPPERLPRERLLMLRNEAIACLAMPDLQVEKQSELKNIAMPVKRRVRRC